jgi:hypothetical protein
MPMPLRCISFERVTFAEDRLLQAQYWAKKTIAERVIAGWDLADDNLMQRGSTDEPEKRAAITFRRVERGER